MDRSSCSLTWQWNLPQPLSTYSFIGNRDFPCFNNGTEGKSSWTMINHHYELWLRYRKYLSLLTVDAGLWEAREGEVCWRLSQAREKKPQLPWEVCFVYAAEGEFRITSARTERVRGLHYRVRDCLQPQLRTSWTIPEPWAAMSCILQWSSLQKWLIPIVIGQKIHRSARSVELVACHQLLSCYALGSRRETIVPPQEFGITYGVPTGDAAILRVPAVAGWLWVAVLFTFRSFLEGRQILSRYCWQQWCNPPNVEGSPFRMVRGTCIHAWGFVILVLHSFAISLFIRVWTKNNHSLNWL